MHAHEYRLQPERAEGLRCQARRWQGAFFLQGLYNTTTFGLRLKTQFHTPPLAPGDARLILALLEPHLSSVS